MNHATSTNCIHPVADFTQVKNKVLNWANRFSTFCFLDNHQYAFEPHSEECILAAGVRDSITPRDQNSLADLQRFIDQEKSWIFGHLNYDLKNEIEGLQSTHGDSILFPEFFFFRPQILIQFDRQKLTIQSEEENEVDIFNEILESEVVDGPHTHPVPIQNRVGKEEYLSIIQQLQRHIVRGDCYEINFCQEFFAENVLIDPLSTYKRLSGISPNPFSAFYRVKDKYLICASPERFLVRQGTQITSQPIKGTSRRLKDRPSDERSKQDLYHSFKDRSENVMVVDLVRNDLSKICEEGSVRVEKLFEIFSFPQVHQMISTVTGHLKQNISFSEIIKATFPMGSMTGAPKKRVMELIEQYEKTKRGIFSGALGYINPEGDFDFNVVIRSILYNAGSRYLSFQTGSAITFHSDAENEWDECILKSNAIRKALETTSF